MIILCSASDQLIPASTPEQRPVVLTRRGARGVMEMELRGRGGAGHVREHRSCLPFSDYDLFLTKVLMRRRTRNLISCPSAAELDASEATVKMHRSQVMKKDAAKSLPELLRMADRLKSIA